MKGRVDDAVIIVTGSSRGIGREVARVLLERGATVVLNGRNRDTLARVAEELGGLPGTARCVAADVTDPDQARRLVEETIAAYGRLDGLVNNAGISMRGLFADLTPAVIRTTMEVNILGASFPTRYALAYLAQSRGGVLFVSSLVGVRGFPGVSVYAASKMALTALCQSIRSEVAQSGVHVGIVYVGFTENDPDKRILAADGSPMVLKRPSHMGQRQVAEAIVKALRRRRRRTVLTPAGHFLVTLVRFVPWLVELVINRSGGKIHQMSR